MRFLMQTPSSSTPLPKPHPVPMHPHPIDPARVSSDVKKTAAAEPGHLGKHSAIPIDSDIARELGSPIPSHGGQLDPASLKEKKKELEEAEEELEGSDEESEREMSTFEVAKALLAMAWKSETVKAIVFSAITLIAGTALLTAVAVTPFTFGISGAIAAIIVSTALIGIGVCCLSYGMVAPNFEGEQEMDPKMAEKLDAMQKTIWGDINELKAKKDASPSFKRFYDAHQEILGLADAPDEFSKGLKSLAARQEELDKKVLQNNPQKEKERLENELLELQKRQLEIKDQAEEKELDAQVKKEKLDEQARLERIIEAHKQKIDLLKDKAQDNELAESYAEEAKKIDADYKALLLPHAK